MKRRTKILIPAIVLIAVACLLLIVLKKKKNETTYTFAEVKKGDIENTVDATGTIEPVTTVEVGTQVSGIIDKIYVDFNDLVKFNQLMAVIDTTILSLQVRDAKASVIKNQAQYDESKYNFERTEKLYRQNLLSEYEYITAKSNYESALSSLMSAQNNLERAERNMRYAFIRSPINGTVIYRSVEEGQTVASSFQTPQLFLIAEDLSKMEIHAQVDESEIGLIKVGQSVRFEVQAYDENTFSGKVRQVWLQPETVQNVVNYTVVVDVENTGGLLLPGMTATIDFLIEEKKDVLVVPIAATRLQPTESMMKTVFENMRKQFGAKSDTGRVARGMPPGGSGRSGRQMPAMGGGAGFGASPGTQSNFAMLWYFDKKKNLHAAPVRTGSSDERNIEITPLRGAEVEPGLQVITGIESSEPAATQNMPRMRFGRGPF